MNRMIWLVAMALLWAPSAAQADPNFAEIFNAGASCVAYRTSKTVLLGLKLTVVGRSCELSLRLQASEDAEDSDSAVLVASVPIASFSSGISMRDHSVAELLHQADQPDLEFRSQPLGAESVRAALQSGSLVMLGALRIGGTDHPVRFDVTLPSSGDMSGGVMATGLYRGTFADFEIEVPPVVGGLIVKPGKKLDLLVQLDVGEILGLDQWAKAHQLAAPATDHETQ